MNVEMSVSDLTLFTNLLNADKHRHYELGITYIAVDRANTEAKYREILRAFDESQNEPKTTNNRHGLRSS